MSFGPKKIQPLKPFESDLGWFLRVLLRQIMSWFSLIDTRSEPRTEGPWMMVTKSDLCSNSGIRGLSRNPQIWMSRSQFEKNVENPPLLVVEAWEWNLRIAIKHKTQPNSSPASCDGFILFDSRACILIIVSHRISVMATWVIFIQNTVHSFIWNTFKFCTRVTRLEISTGAQNVNAVWSFDELCSSSIHCQARGLPVYLPL